MKGDKERETMFRVFDGFDANCFPGNDKNVKER
jgi:hypothetical protein